MTNQVNQAFEKWFEEWRLSTWKPLPNDARKECPKHWAMNAKHHMDIAWNARDKSPISQNEQQEAVEALRERDRLGFSVVEVIGKLDEIIEVAEDIEFNDFAHIAIPLELWNELKDALDLMPERADNYTSPPKQIPDGWKPIETVPKDGTQVIIKCSGGRVATAFYDDKPFVGEGWHVVVPFLGGFGSGTDTFIYFPEDMPTHWMPLPSAPTNTEVGND